MGAFLMVFKTLTTILKLISTGEKIYHIFHPDKVNVSTLISDMENAVQTILHQELTKAAITEAQGVLQNGIDFININYYNAIQSNASNEEIWTLLTTGDGSQRLNDLENQMDTMGQLSLDQNETVQTLPVYILISGVCISLYQARARYAPNDDEKNTNIANIVSYAKTYSSRISNIINWIEPQRIGSVKPVKFEDDRNEYYFRDAWIGDKKMLKASIEPTSFCVCNNDAMQKAIQNLQAQHIKLLQSGSQTDFNQLYFYTDIRGQCIGQDAPTRVENCDVYFDNEGTSWPPSTKSYVYQVVEFGAMISQSQQCISYLADIQNNPLPDPS